jgi:aspartyl protease family protein
MSIHFTNEGLIIVPTRLFGPTGKTMVVQLALDTGATSSVISWDVIVTLGYDPAIVEERIQITTGSGMVFVPRITIEQIEAIGQTCNNLPILCHTLPPSAIIDGLLGLDFLRIIKKQLIVDFRHGVLTLQ